MEIRNVFARSASMKEQSAETTKTKENFESFQVASAFSAVSRSIPQRYRHIMSFLKRKTQHLDMYEVGREGELRRSYLIVYFFVVTVMQDYMQDR